jgi:hypothetical protein
MLDVSEQLQRLLHGSDSTYSREELTRKLTRSPKPANRCASSWEWTRPRQI